MSPLAPTIFTPLSPSSALARCYARPGAMASAFARYRGIARQVEHNARHLSRPLGLPVMAVGGERAFGSAVAENLRHGASDVRQEVIADCGHYVSEERPGRARQLAAQLLRRDVNALRPIAVGSLEASPPAVSVSR
jgi:pimeloyl-ACP methyl ester carboxylesterase